MSFFVKACVTALKEIPDVNAEIQDNNIIYKNFYNIGVAVGTDQGLVVPVVRNADKKSIIEIEKEIFELGNKARSGKLSIFVYSILMLPVVILPYIIGFVGLPFLIPSLVLTIYYNYLCFELYKFKKNKFDAKKAKTIFGYSILYLFLIFVLFLIDKIL